MEGLEQPPVGSLQGIVIRDVQARNCGTTGCSVTGIPGHPARNIRISGLQLQFRGGVSAGEAAGEVPELEDYYPEATMFGVLPASVCYLRHLEGVDIRDVRVAFKEEDSRPHLVTEDVLDLQTGNLRIMADPRSGTGETAFKIVRHEK
jgi:hypothetical protein